MGSIVEKHKPGEGADRRNMLDVDVLSNDKRLNRLLNSVITEVRLYAEDQIKRIKKLAEIGLALSVEKDIGRLLELIVDEARALSNADGGTLYILDGKKRRLRFEILQNTSMNTRMGGTSGGRMTFTDVPLYINGRPNYSNVSSYVALTGKSVNIPDVYQADGFDFRGPREYDKTTGYRSKSMLVIPLKDHENDIIGVLQLLNAVDPETNEVIAFSTEYAELIAALASQAAVALTNTQLIEDLKNLFYAFIKSIATAIDEKSPYTGGHINRVVDLTMMIAEHVNRCETGPLKDVFFSNDELEELRMAAWMHDVGKITTPEYIVDKASKLETIFDRAELIETRFNLIEKTLENEYLTEKLRLLEDRNKKEPDRLEKQYKEDAKRLREDLELIKNCNLPGGMITDETINALTAIGRKSCTIRKKYQPYLTENELKNLSVRRGTLIDEERKVVENHAAVTLKILQQLPFPKRLSRVPEIAGGHHERLDGTGYPRRLIEKDLPLQTRILAIADVFEALTAKDRPYKKPMKLSQAIEIMEEMKQARHIDPDIYDLFIQTGLYLAYARKEVNPDQMD
ncbi:MAG: HD domain-containing phosphohydrolase [Desulfobacterales bacterium]